MLLRSMAVMTVAMLATALLPDPCAGIEPAAGGVLLLLRCLMEAFSVGGEYTGVVAYLLEGAPSRTTAAIDHLAWQRPRARSAALLAVAKTALTVPR